MPCLEKVFPLACVLNLMISLCESQAVNNHSLFISLIDLSVSSLRVPSLFSIFLCRNCSVHLIVCAILYVPFLVH